MPPINNSPDLLSNFPKLLKGAIVALDPTSNVIVKTILFQYNPETLTRTLQVQASSREGGDRAEALRLKGSPIETIRFDVEFETTGPLSGAAEQAAVSVGIYPQLSALETLIYPDSQQVRKNMQQADQGVLEIAPLEAPLSLLVWGKKRVLPVRLTDFSITEEAYDVNLNPIRAKVTLSLRVLNYDDLPWDQRGSKLFLAHHEEKERLAQRGSVNYSSEITGVGINQILL
jgi:Contractile injection system tube protein